jgi:large subunit ribosomal protein L10
VERAQKVEIVADLHDIFANAGLVVVTHQNGLTVGEATELRRRMRERNATYRVIKNSLTQLALGDTPYQGLADLFDGPTAIAYSDDPVAAAKVAVDYAKTNDKLVILGGGLRETVLGLDEVKALASLPSLDESRGNIVGLLNAPATKIAGVLQAPAAQMARVLGAYAARDEAA